MLSELYENKILCGDALEILKDVESDSIDCIVTDPPYGYSFMNKDWDKAVVSVDIWKECLRVMKSGSFAFIMSSPRQDVLCKMILNLIDAGFETNFTSIYWSYASGFPKAANVSKLVDKRGYENERYSELSKELCDYLKLSREKQNLSQKDIAKYFPSKTGGLTGCVWNWENGANIPTMEQWHKLKQILNLHNDKFNEIIEIAILKREEAEREIIETKNKARSNGQDFALPTCGKETKYIYINYTKSATEAAKKLDGLYAGFQPKPALETILVVMKPLSEKSYVDQALNNSKGITWLDDCRIPFQNESEQWKRGKGWSSNGSNEGWKLEVHDNYEDNERINDKGRFPANLIVSDDSLNDGKIRKVGTIEPHHEYHETNKIYGKFPIISADKHTSYGDSGSYSRYFSLDKWYEAQFIITPKASPSERNKGLENEPIRKSVNDGRLINCDVPQQRGQTFKQNYHPTVKPIKLMSYLITMGSRENDIILDPFCGSGTTCIAAYQLNRRFIGIEKEKDYVDIANTRLEPYLKQQKLVI